MQEHHHSTLRQQCTVSPCAPNVARLRCAVALHRRREQCPVAPAPRDVALEVAAALQAVLVGALMREGVEGG